MPSRHNLAGTSSKWVRASQDIPEKLRLSLVIDSTHYPALAAYLIQAPFRGGNQMMIDLMQAGLQSMGQEFDAARTNPPSWPAASTASKAQETQVKRGRGRPPKNKQATYKQQDLVLPPCSHMPDTEAYPASVPSGEHATAPVNNTRAHLPASDNASADVFPGPTLKPSKSALSQETLDNDGVRIIRVGSESEIFHEAGRPSLPDEGPQEKIQQPTKNQTANTPAQPPSVDSANTGLSAHAQSSILSLLEI